MSSSEEPEILAKRRKTGARNDFLSWDDFFMSAAIISSLRSKDPVTQVGACIVNQDNRIVGLGYNGMPNRCSDDKLPWGKEKGLDHKLLYVCHAEMNAVLNKISSSLKGCTIYVSLFPCNECAKIIIQSGISKVIYYSDKYYYKKKTKASKRLLDAAKVPYNLYKPTTKEIVLEF